MEARQACERLLSILEYDKIKAYQLWSDNSEIIEPIVTRMMGMRNEFLLISKYDLIIVEFLELIDGNGFKVHENMFSNNQYLVSTITWNSEE